MIDRNGRVVSRRAILGTAVTTSALPVVGEARGDETATLRVRVVPTVAEGDRFGGWSVPAIDAFRSVGASLEQLATYIETNSATVADVAVEVDADTGLRLPTGLNSDDLLTEFQEAIAERGREQPDTAHLLLCDEPLNPDIGYGRARAHVATSDGAVAICNLGATERWDGRAVTRNMSIHEVLHTFLDDDAVASVVESTCDHDLGTVRQLNEGVRAVTPIATAYAGEPTPGSETAWHGSGCGDHDRFYRHDGAVDADGWRHTTRLSDGTLEAVQEYVERRLI